MFRTYTNLYEIIQINLRDKEGSELSDPEPKKDLSLKGFLKYISNDRLRVMEKARYELENLL